MPPDDENKLNRIEELKAKLFNKNFHTKLEHRDEFSDLPKSDVSDSWETRPKGGPNFLEKFFMKTSVFKKFFLFALGFFVLTLAYGAYVFFFGSNTVSSNNIDISIVGNSFTAGGEDLPLVVSIANKNTSSLDLVDLVIEYPKGSGEDQASSTERIRKSIGSIPSGSVHNESVKLVLFGEQGTARTVKFSIEYRVAGSNAIFVKDKLYDVNITSTPINLSVDAPSSISPNQDIALNIKTTLNATKPAGQILVRVDYPLGFQFKSATPAPSFGNNVWSLGDLSPGAERDISISGKMVGVFDGEDKTFNISTGSQSDANKYQIGTVFNSIGQTVSVKKPFIDAQLFFNGQQLNEYAVDAKTRINAEIRYSNNLDTAVNNLKIQAKLSGNAFNRNTVNTSEGFYDSSTDIITWDGSSKSDLRVVNPGDTGSLTFSISPLSLFSASGGILSNPTINIEVDVSGSQSVEGAGVNEISNSSSAVVRIISDIGFAAKALHYSGPFANTGPIPPKAENSTTYTVVWTLSNTANSISQTQVTSTLPAWSNFVGPISPSSEDLTYNSSTKEVVWNVDRIPKGAGITGPSREVAFQISFKPSLSQVDTIPDIINEAVLTGHDDFANLNVRVTKPPLRTQLDSDPAFPLGGATVTN